MYRNILVATDFSESRADMIFHAIQVAEQYKAKLHVLHVIEDAPHYLLYVDAYPLLIEFHKAAKEASDRRMQLYLHDFKQKFPNLDSSIEFGPVAYSIVKKAEALKSELIILGTHVLTGIKGLFHKSVALEVAHSAPCDVLIYKIKNPRSRT